MNSQHRLLAKEAGLQVVVARLELHEYRRKEGVAGDNLGRYRRGISLQVLVVHWNRGSSVRSSL